MTSEAEILNRIKLEASSKGSRLWRNNVGATYTAEGSFIRYGLANDSKALNQKLKSADLIGIKPVVITEEMVGRTIGQFLSREIKRPNWKFNKNDTHDTAQLNWINLIVSLGGDACFALDEGTL